MIDKVPASAPDAPPLTAALINVNALSSSTLVPNSFIDSGSSVLMTMIVLPSGAAESSPSSPKMTSMFCAWSRTIEMIASSDCSATSLRVSTMVMPAAAAFS